jgi:hypothetical protein
MNNLWKCVTVKYAPCYLRKAPVLRQNAHTCKKKKTASWMNTLSCSTIFSALSMHYPQRKTLPLRTQKCHLLHHGYNAVADDSWRKCRPLHHGYNAVAMTLGPAAILFPGFWTGSRQKRSKRVKYCGSIHTLRPPPDQGGDVYKIWLRSV